MSIIYTDEEIHSLINESKNMPSNWQAQIRLQRKTGHDEKHLNLAREAGGEFRLIFRKSQINPLDFSLILAVRSEKSSRLFRLRRYNGKSHEHNNRIERQKFYDFHIHTATERYQELGSEEDTFAEVTSRYDNYWGALQCLIDDAKLILPHDSQRDIFAEA